MCLCVPVHVCSTYVLRQDGCTVHSHKNTGYSCSNTFLSRCHLYFIYTYMGFRRVFDVRTLLCIRRTTKSNGIIRTYARNDDPCSQILLSIFHLSSWKFIRWTNNAHRLTHTHIYTFFNTFSLSNRKLSFQIVDYLSLSIFLSHTIRSLKCV